MQRTMKRLMMVAVAVLFGSGRADAAYVIDQQSTVNDATSGAGVVGQSFTPGLTGINFATFLMATLGTTTTARVDLFQGSGFAGTLLASTGAVTLTNIPPAPVEFDFGSIISLTPGTTYTLRVIETAGSGLLFDYSMNNPYAGGVLYTTNGAAIGGADLVFTEGINISAVPEPASFALLGVGITAAAVGRSARRRRVAVG